MGTLTVSKKQRLRTLEKEILSGMEEFYYVGQKLKEIRDDELYKEDGFDTWEKYCKERWEWDRSHVHRLISASEYRAKLPTLPSGQQEWSERSVRELTRIPDKRQAARVAEKVVKHVEKESAKDPKVKLSASVVRRFVDDDLGIDRSAKSAETKQRNNAGIDLRAYLQGKLGTIEGTTAALRAVPKGSWKLLDEDHPGLAERLAKACDKLAALLRS